MIFDFISPVEFIDSDGSIIVPKAVRPIIDLKESLLGSKNGARRQFRNGRLHVREYEGYYTVHSDRVDPGKDPLGHLLMDAPEYIAGACVAIAVGKRTYSKTLKAGRALGRNDAALGALVAACIAGSSAGKVAYDVTRHLKKAKTSDQAGN